MRGKSFHQRLPLLPRVVAAPTLEVPEAADGALGSLRSLPVQPHWDPRAQCFRMLSACSPASWLGLSGGQGQIFWPVPKIHCSLLFVEKANF